MHTLSLLRTFSGLALASVITICPMSAQKGGGSNPPGATSGAGVPSRTPDMNPTSPGRTNPTSPTNPNSQSPFPETPRPIYLSGKVALEDGSPLPEQVLIERVCNGNPRPEGYADTKGRFHVQLGQNSAVFADASTSGGIGDRGFGSGPVSGPGGSRGLNERDLMGCEIRASLAGFRSDSISLAGRRSLDNPDIGTIVLHRLAKVDGFTFSGTTAYAPKDARKAYEKGLEASKKEKWPIAEKELQKAVDLYPKYAVAWYELGRVNQMQGRLDEANKYYGESLKADGKYVNPYGELTRLAVAKQNWQEAVDYSEKLIKLNPYYSPDVYFFNAMAQYNLHHLKEAETSARTAIEMDKQHRNPRSYHLLGVVLARNQDLKGAAENMNLYLKFAPDSKEAPMVRQQLDEINKQLSPQAASAQQP